MHGLRHVADLKGLGHGTILQPKCMSSMNLSCNGPLLLGLDIGTTHIKAILVDRDGNEIPCEGVATPFSSVPPGVEMTVHALHESIAGVLGRLSGWHSRVAAVGIAGMAECGAPLDETGRVLGPVIAWHDPRGAETVARLLEHFGDSLALRTGQRPRTVSSVAKLGWMIDHGCRGVRRWLGVPELCLWLLTGQQATEHSLACRTGAYDVASNTYLPEVAEVAGLPAGVFPPVGSAGATLGCITPEGATWSGLPEGIPVTLAGHDHLAGAEGIGAREGDLVNSVGTAETVLRQSTTLPNLNEALALRAAVSVRPGGRGWTVLVGAARAGFVLSAAARALGRTPTELDRLAETAGRVDAGPILARLEAGDPIVFPSTPPGALWHGLLEALATRTLEAGARLDKLLGPSRRLLVFGGGSRSRPWMQAKARLSALPVYRLSTGEAAARGAAMSAGVAAGWWPGMEATPAPAAEVVEPMQT